MIESQKVRHGTSTKKTDTWHGCDMSNESIFKNIGHTRNLKFYSQMEHVKDFDNTVYTLYARDTVYYIKP